MTEEAIAALAVHVRANTDAVERLETAVRLRTKTRTVVTLAAAVLIVLGTFAAALNIVNDRLAEHVDGDHTRWCAVFQALGESGTPDAAAIARKALTDNRCTAAGMPGKTGSAQGAVGVIVHAGGQP